MSKLYDFFSSSSCRSVLLLCFILLIHAYIKIRAYATELNMKTPQCDCDYDYDRY